MGNKKESDDKIHGKTHKHVNQLFIPDCIEMWEGHVHVDETGSAWLPMDVAFRILEENEHLRETLYGVMTHHQERSTQLIHQAAGHSTREILHVVKSIERFSHNVLTGKEVFTFIYRTMARDFGVNFKDCPSTESKIQWCWKQGYLPIVSFLAEMLLSTMRSLRSTNHKAFDRYLADIAKSLKKPPKPAKTHKVRNPRVPF